MAADAEGRRPRYYRGRPGVDGAIKDAVEAIVNYASPSIVRGRTRRRVVDDATDEAAIGRMRKGQSTDSNNKY